MIQGDLADVMERLRSERTPFVVATVVRARRPTSVRPGDAAVVLPDGTIDGFVGGICAETSVRLHSLRAMETGEPLLLALVPGDAEQSDAALGQLGSDPGGGAVVERNPCLSGGALEIFLEPHLPPARLVVVGTSPIAQALATLARAGGYECVRCDTGVDVDVEVGGAAAVIVSSHGHGEEEVIGAALTAGVPYVALVASRRRGDAVRAELAVPAELAAQLHTPAGLDIGARTPVEIAISILAELIAHQHADPTRVPGPTRPAGVAQAPAPSVVAVATDPVCGMRVAVTAAAPRLEVDGERVYFCSDRCRDGYAREPGADRAAH